MLIRKIKTVGLLSLILLQGCASTDSVRQFSPDVMKNADQAHHTGDLGNAISQYREAIKQDPSNRAAYLKLGYALLDGNHVNEAYKTFKEAEKRFGKCPDTHRGMGAVLLVMDRPEEAMHQFNHVLNLKPQDARALNGQGLAFELMGHTPQAQVAYRAAMELDPSNINYESNYALSLALDGKPHEALHILERLARDPNVTPRVRQNLALAYGLAGEMNKARHVGRLDLPDAMVKNNLNYIRAVKGMPTHSSRFANVLPTNREQVPLNAARSWNGGS